MGSFYCHDSASVTDDGVHRISILEREVCSKYASMPFDYGRFVLMTIGTRHFKWVDCLLVAAYWISSRNLKELLFYSNNHLWHNNGEWEHNAVSKDEWEYKLQPNEAILCPQGAKLGKVISSQQLPESSRATGDV